MLFMLNTHTLTHTYTHTHTHIHAYTHIHIEYVYTKMYVELRPVERLASDKATITFFVSGIAFQFGI